MGQFPKEPLETFHPFNLTPHHHEEDGYSGYCVEELGEFNFLPTGWGRGTHSASLGPTSELDV